MTDAEDTATADAKRGDITPERLTPDTYLDLWENSFSLHCTKGRPGEMMRPRETAR